MKHSCLRNTHTRMIKFKKCHPACPVECSFAAGVSNSTGPAKPKWNGRWGSAEVLRLTFLLLAIFLLTFLSAEEVTKPDSVKTRYYQLEGIRVIAETPQQSIGSVAVKSFDLRQTTPEVNVAQALSEVNGLDISTGGKSGSDLRIRGYSNDRIKFLLDGRPLGGGYFGNVDLSTIPISEIKEIQVLKGPVSSLFGSDTMGGVVNIITRSAGNDKWLKIGSQFKRNNTNKFYLSSSHDFENWDYHLYASRYHTDGFMLSEDFQSTAYENGTVRNFTARNQYDFQSKLNFTLFDFHSFGIQAGYTFMDKKEIPGSIYENKLRRFTDWQRLQLAGMASIQLSPWLKSDLNVFYDQYDDTYAEYNPVTGTMYSTWPSYLESWIFGLHQKNDWEISASSRLLFGYRFEKEVYNRKDNGNYQDWTSNNQLKQNGFIQMEYKLGDFNFSAGTGMSFFQPKGVKNWQSNLEPAVGIFWQKGWKTSLAFSSNIRYPSLHQLFSSSSGNPELKEERAEKYELTLQLPFTFSQLSGSFSNAVFYNDISNLIEKAGDIYQNIYEVQNYGWESTLQLKFGWEHQFDLAAIKYSDESNLSLLEVPEYSFNLTETAELPWRVKLQYKAAWKDVRRVLNDAGEEASLPSYWLHSIFLHKNWQNYKFMVGLENLFDQNYFEKFGYPGPGRNFVVNVEVEI